MISQTLALPKAFNYNHILTYLSRSEKELLHQVIDQTVYKWITHKGVDLLFSIQQNDSQSLTINLLNQTDHELIHPVMDFIRGWWDLDLDLEAFYKVAKRDDLLEPIIERLYGLRVIGVNDLFEALCWSVIGQQVNLPFAYTLKKRLVEMYGKKSTWEGQSFWQFPQPNTLSNVTIDELKSLSLTTRKSEYIIGIAKLIEAGQVSKVELLALRDHKLMEKQLVNIRGIGPWAANYVLLRCLRTPSAYPIGDVGLQNAVKKRLQMDRKPTGDELMELAKNWPNWEGYATFYLWQSLSLTKV
ncbi:UNVERIFIED_CONTAM: hypothetical protein GTU68_016659 [Idotea baltica]|nr:hypothetical protein [Idotea baltica]